MGVSHLVPPGQVSKKHSVQTVRATAAAAKE